MKIEEDKGIPFDFRQLYTTRMVLMLETSPQSGLFRQIQLTQDQFKKISDSIYFSLGGDTQGNFIQMTVTDKAIKLPDTLQDFY